MFKFVAVNVILALVAAVVLGRPQVDYGQQRPTSYAAEAKAPITIVSYSQSGDSKGWKMNYTTSEGDYRYEDGAVKTVEPNSTVLDVKGGWGYLDKSTGKVIQQTYTGGVDGTTYNFSIDNA